jgi:tetratricopeptide (TPR) repeat protein
MCRPNAFAPPPQSALAGLTNSYRRGEMQQVIVDAGMLLERHAGVEAVYVLMGAAHLSLKQYAEAEATFRRALAAGIRQAGIYSNLGMAIAEQGRHDEALESYRAAIALDPSRASAHNNLGNVLKSCGHLPEAIEAYAKAIALDPAYADAFNNMGLALEMAGRGDEALAAYAQALAINPGHTGALNNLGNVRNGLATGPARSSATSRPSRCVPTMRKRSPTWPTSIAGRAATTTRSPPISARRSPARLRPRLGRARQDARHARAHGHGRRHARPSAGHRSKPRGRAIASPVSTRRTTATGPRSTTGHGSTRL